MEATGALRYRINDDTICALATPPGTAAIAVVRISGKDTFAIIDKFLHPAMKID